MSHPTASGPIRSVTHSTPRSLWLDQAAPIERRAALNGDIDVDVAIVGGGFSGLWTAYYLTELDPTLRIAVIEKHHCGFGASGRNGGWAVGELAGPRSQYAALSTPAEAHRLELATFDAVDEIGRVTESQNIDCGYKKGGNIRLARTQPQADRQRAEVDEARAHGFTDEHLRLLDTDEASNYCNATKVRGGIFFAPCASLDPARLVRGLADTVEQRGVTIYEGTTVSAIDNRVVTTDRGRVRADVTVRALEAYTRDLEGARRDVLPVYSLMIATEPLADDVFDEIGLADRPTFCDDRTMVIYGQRTDDNRLAFGGTGIPYVFGSKIDPSVELNEAAHQRIHEILVDLLPTLRDADITHRWGGVLGIPRNWLPSVHHDRASGVATLGGYVGEGVAAANLAGRTLAELISGADTDRTSLPWVGARNRRWEPEPLRWLGVRTSRRFLAAADAREERTDKEATASMWLAGVLRGD